MGKNYGYHNVVSRYCLAKNAKGVSVVYRKAIYNCEYPPKSCENHSTQR